MKRFLLSWLALSLAAMTLPAAEPAMPVYRWEAGQVYRYQLLRRAEVTPVNTDAGAVGRVTECRGVLVLAVESVAKDGTATAEIRLVTPQISIPPSVVLDAEEDKRSENVLVARPVARAMEDILAETRWPVTIAADGTIRVIGPQPEDWRAWMQRMEQVGRWPKRMATQLGQLLDAHFRVGREETDDEWLPVMRKEPVGPRGDGLRAFRPRRSLEIDTTTTDGRVRLKLQRLAEEDPAPVSVPLIDAKITPPRLTRGEVKTLKGEALFDPQTGLLDSASESFQVTLISRCANQEQRVLVKVDYELKRLAPPVRGEAGDQPADGPK